MRGLGPCLAVSALALATSFATGESSEASCEARGAELCGLAPALDGIFALVLGMITASVIDSAALAWTSATPDAAAPPAPKQSLRLVPMLGVRCDDLRRDEARRDDAHRDDARAIEPTLGVAGTF
jgi:hypothetical protein